MIMFGFFHRKQPANSNDCVLLQSSGKPNFIALHALHTVHGAGVSGACRERAAAGGTGQGGYMMPLYINKVNMQKRNKERLYS